MTLFWPFLLFLFDLNLIFGNFVFSFPEHTFNARLTTAFSENNLLPEFQSFSKIFNFPYQLI